MLHGLFVEPRHRHGDHPISVERTIGERVGRISRLGQVGVVEFILVDNEDAAGLQIAEVDLQRRRIHGHQHVRQIAGGMHLVIGETELEAADSP